MNNILSDTAAALAKRIEKISDAIWDVPETRYQEYHACNLQETFLNEMGFSIEHGIGGIDTAFKAVWGTGSPVISFLGEYDALPGLSQEADALEICPIQKNGPGHGCGHNLLGSGSLEGAVLAKTYLEQTRQQGTIIYFGCPAEESGAGKTFLVREGCFHGVDFALTWHPYYRTGLMNHSLANVRVIFNFFGKSSHAAANPEDGRSALDACELMNVGVNYLREHVDTRCRMHYAYLNSGGTAPNIVPHHTSLLYALRAPEAYDVNELLERVSDVAKGAAMMTGTSVEIKVVSSYANLLSVPSMDKLMNECMHQIEIPSYTKEDFLYAKQYSTAESVEKSILPDVALENEVLSTGSTDVGDVSWNVPTGSIMVTTMANGSIMHGWNVVAQGKSHIAHLGMHRAAKILASAAIQLVESPEARDKITEEFNKIKETHNYISLLPKSMKPGEF